MVSAELFIREKRKEKAIVLNYALSVGEILRGLWKMKHERQWHTCDRCGKEIKVGLLATNSITRNGILNTTYDLCNECMEEFERFMENEK